MRSRAVRASTMVAACVSMSLSWIAVSAHVSGAASPSLTIAFVCNCTGPGAPEDAGVQGAFLARIKQQNAEGGVDGRQLTGVIYDDQTSPSADATAIQEAVSKNPIGIVADSALFFSGAKYAQQAGIPVTGSFQDGPEWGEQPYTNMFASDAGSVDPKYPVNTAIGKFLVSHGGNVVGAYGYSISPSSTRSATGTAQSVIHAGGKQGVLDTTVPFGGVDFTSAALTAKANHVNGLFAAMDDNSNFALVTSMKQAGVKLKAVVLPTGYEPAAITSPAWADLQGVYFASVFRPFQLPNAGTAAMQSSLIKYDGFTKSQFPTFEQYESWVGADLMIKGIQLAGKNPTQSKVIHALRNVKSYDANGLLSQSINYSTIFGHDLPRACTWYLQAQSKGFVPVGSQPVCGTDIPGTATATGS
jgi:branched-chain amino acid transport system substrate-binding protein